MRAWLVTLVAVAVAADALHAQDVSELVAAGRYDDAVAALENAAPEDARAGAMQIFDHAYRTEFQRARYEAAAGAFAAARSVPNLDEGARELLDFWQGVAWYSSAGDRKLSEAEVATRLERAQTLIEASGDYARRASLPNLAAVVERELTLSGRARD